MSIFVAALMLCGCSGSDNGKSSRSGVTVHNVFVTSPEADDGSGIITFPATVEEGRSIAVGFKTAGQIERIYVKEGDRVTVGQPIALLDTVDYALGISTLREKYHQLKTETERRAKLHASGNMSDNDYENALSGLRQLELQLRLEENKLAYCRLKSPAAGIVTKVNFENSEMVDAGTPVIELMDNSSLEAIVDLPVRQYAERESFASFSGSLPAEPGSNFPLQMLSLTPRADNSQLYRLRLAVPATVGVTPGMNISVTIDCQGNESGVVSVPLSAVFAANGVNCVWVLNPADSVVSARQVVISGSGEDGRIDVTSGLTPTDIIVRAGVHHLVEGEKVNVISEHSETNPGNVL